MIKFFCLVLMCCCFSAQAQQEFMIYNYKGKVSVKDGTKKKAVKIGDKLKQNAVVSLQQNASVTFICSNYASFSVNKKGSFLLSSFTDSCVKERSGFSMAYFSYLWAQFSHPHMPPEKMRREYMQNKGAVTRGPGNLIIDNRFDTLLVTGIDKGSLQWQSALPVERLSFVLYDAPEDGTLLFEKKLSHNKLNLDSIRVWLSKGSPVFWGIWVDGEEKSERKYLQQVPEQEYMLLEKNIAESIPEGANTAEISFAKGFALENHHYLFKAATSYERASTLEPTNDIYKAAAKDNKY